MLYQLPVELLSIIAEFLVDPYLREPAWLPWDSWRDMEEIPSWIPWTVDDIAGNPHPCALRIIRERWRELTSMGWSRLCSNRSAAAMDILIEPHYCWYSLSRNPTAIRLLRSHREKINWLELAKMPTAEAMELMADYLQSNAYQRMDKLEEQYTYIQSMLWCNLSANPAAIELLRTHPEKIVWNALARNPAGEPLWREDRMSSCVISANPAAVGWLAAHPELIHWPTLSENPAAIGLLRAHPDRVVVDRLIDNPAAEAVLMAMERGVRGDALSRHPHVLQYVSASELNEEDLSRVADASVLLQDPSRIVAARYHRQSVALIHHTGHLIAVHPEVLEWPSTFVLPVKERGRAIKALWTFLDF